MCKCASDIIIGLITRLGSFLKLRHYQIIASGAIAERSHLIMDFLTSIHAEHKITALFIHKIKYLIIEKYSIGSHCETELLVMCLLKFPSVSHYFLYHLKIHKRFSAKEVNFKIPSVSRIGHQKIKCLLTHLGTHKGSSSVIFAFLGKTVFACKITVMCYVKAHRLDYIFLCFALRKLFYTRFINILRE